MQILVRPKLKCNSKLLRALILLSFLFFATGCPPKNRSTYPSEPPPPDYYYHSVRWSGETLSIIAGWYTGAGANWELLMEHNPGLDPRRMHIGQQIAIPRDLMVRQDPLPRSAVQGGGTRRPSVQPEPDNTETATEDSRPPTSAEPSDVAEPPSDVTEQPLDMGNDTRNVENTAPTEDSQTSSAGTNTETTTTQPGDDVVVHDQGAANSGQQASAAGSAGSAKPEMRIKTRDELLKELLEE